MIGTKSYGSFTLCRPVYLPHEPDWPAATLVDCAYCGGKCWKRDVEPNPIPEDYAVACTTCALKRLHHQADMDYARFLREAGGVQKHETN